jgi:hypothetical protein
VWIKLDKKVQIELHAARHLRSLDFEVDDLQEFVGNQKHSNEYSCPQTSLE